MFQRKEAIYHFPTRDFSTGQLRSLAAKLCCMFQLGKNCRPAIILNPHCHFSLLGFFISFFWRQTNSKFTLYCRIECWLKLLLHKSSICSFTKFWRSLHFCKALLPVAWKSGDATLVLEMETRYPTLLPPMQWFEENCRYQFLVYCFPSGVNREVIVENGIFELLYKGFMSSEEPSNWNKFVLRHFCKYLSLSIDVNVP